ncbi:MAG: D-alanine--D-alanine ligase [Candidatus Omnitrophota bacterium]
MEEGLGRIGVLMGGPSSEREISLKSGRAVYQALKEQGLDVVPLEIYTDAEEKIKEADIAAAFIALHGKFGEDGRVQKILQDLDIPYTGSGVIASFLCFDKVASRRVLKHCNITVPKYEVLQQASWKKRIEEISLNFPVVVKPSNQGSSVGITFVNESSALPAAVEYAFNYDDTALIDEYINGREITVGILDDAPLPVVEIVPKNKFFDFQAKYEKGKTEYIVPARLSARTAQRAQNIGLLAHRGLGCHSFSRVDMILADEHPVVLEVNSIPGLTATSLLPMAAQAEGIDFGRLCGRILQSAFCRRDELTQSYV